MTTNTGIHSIYVNLPIHDVTKTREFWTRLGFSFNEQFSDDKGLCLILDEGKIYVMLVSHEYYKTFTDRPVADGSATQVLLAINVGSRSRVDEIVQAALKNGGTRYLQPIDIGWMYYDRFADPDGHQWEIMCLNNQPDPKE